MRPTTLLFAVLFVLSGFAGLVHETLWARYLGMVLGHSAYGQILTLATYMGGIALGSALAGRWARRTTSPLLAYALVELGIAAGGFAFHHEFLAARSALLDSGLLAGRSEGFATAAAVAAGIALTLPWAVLIGMTYPLATAHLLRLLRDDGADSVARLYFANSLGAALGALVCSYLLVPRLGTAGALGVAGTLNASVALLAWLGGGPRRTAPIGGDAAAGKTRPETPIPKVGLLLAAALATGLSSFLYEIGWIRYLALLLGSSTHAFDLMVSAFVLGLAVGAWLVHRRPSADLARTLVLAQLCMAGAAVLGVLGAEPIFRFSNELNRIFQRTPESYPFFMLARFGLCLAVMLPATVFAGTTLPLLCRLFLRAGAGEEAAGRVYAWNTLGAIAGAVAGGLLLMPLLGPFRLVGVGAAIDLALALVLMVGLGQGRGILLPAVGGVAGLLVAASLVFEPASWIVAAGAFRAPVLYHPSEEERLVHGRTASIRIQREQGLVILSTNGKSDASLQIRGAGAGPGDALTQSMLGWIARSHMRGPYRAAMVGMGSGQSAQTLLEDPRCLSLDLVEIEPAVHELARWFSPRNDLVYDDARSHVRFQDARVFFARQRAPFDLVVSEPSNPWVSGVSSLFTREFYAEMSSRMTGRGVLVQWLHSYEMRSDAIRSVLAALREVFPHAAVLAIPGDHDFFVVASRAPLSPAVLEGVTDSVQMAAGGLARADFAGPLEILGDRSIDLLAAGAPPNSEFAPVVDGMAENAFFLRMRATLLEEIQGGSVWLDSLPGATAATRLLPPEGRIRLLARGLPGEQARRGFRRLLSDPDTLDALETAWIHGQFRTAFPPWSWGLPEVAPLVESFRRRLDARGDTGADARLFRWGLLLARGRRDSARAALLPALSRLPPDLPPETIRDIYAFLVVSGEEGRASGLREEISARRPELSDRADIRFLDELRRGGASAREGIEGRN